ncbi:hypothetical protein M8C21_002008, partial [Ambrosia artemisiifolia]
EEMKNSRIRKRASSSSQTHPRVGQPELHFTFFHRPNKFLESNDKSGQVAGVNFEKTTLKGSAGAGNQIAAGTGEYEDLKCGLVLKSIGYKSIPVDGLPFDYSKGVVPNIRGRVLSSSDVDQPETGLWQAFLKT